VSKKVRRAYSTFIDFMVGGLMVRLLWLAVDGGNLIHLQAGFLFVLSCVVMSIVWVDERPKE